MILRTFLVLISAMASFAFSQSNCVYLASDIYPGSYGALPVSITEYNGALYFRATGNSAGAELWKYENGTASMVEDINPGIGGSMPNQLTVLNGELYFTATTATTGMELYKYDGVSVILVADINPGTGNSTITNLTVIGNELYFSANDGVNGTEPWKFDGTNTMMVADINPGSTGSGPKEFASAGGLVFFSAYHPTYGLELWKYDGSTAVVQDLYPGANGSDLGELTTIGSKICFRATNGTQGYELWEHDGTTATCLDVCTTGPGDFTPWEFTKLGSEVFFRGFNQATGYELWKYDGTTTVMVLDIYPGSGNAHPNHLKAGSTVLYFAANDGNTGNELWMHDGTTTSLVSDINPGSTESMPYAVTEEFVTIGDDVFIVADDGVSGNEVWRYDGTSVELGKDIVAGNSSSSPTEMIGFGDTLFFMADDINTGGELWAWSLNQDLTETITVVTCDDFTSPAGNLYTSVGTYNFVDVIPSINCPGCDSLITVNLTIVNPDTSITIFTCDSYTSPAGDYYTIPDNYIFTDTIPSIACPGVDSIIDIDLTIEANLNTSITTFGNVVFVSQPGANYQWLDCNAGYAPIPGETDQDYLPPVAGNYACEMTIGLCTDTTNCVYVEPSDDVGLTDQNTSQISVYPNPVNNQLRITHPTDPLTSVKIFNVLGKEIYTEEAHQSEIIEIDMSKFAKGIYYLEVSTINDNFIKQIVKE